jgi:hypothetical protein
MKGSTICRPLRVKGVRRGGSSHMGENKSRKKLHNWVPGAHEDEVCLKSRLKADPA